IYSFNNAKNISNKLNQIIPDTTVNMKLKLSNLLSLQQFFSGYKDDQNLIIGLRESPIAIFFNKSKLEYLFAYQYEGSSKNTFDCFEIGYLKNESRLNNVNYYNTSIDSFLTESNLGLGITLDKLESIKGTNYIKTNYADLTKIIYRNSDFDNTAFLKRYSMPSYFMEFTLKENKVIMLKYGFDYP
ncbi:MAG: hypothetical protein ORN58_03895, partial [Sediminibacterium sp.]|nr:hypothetical protein [Sediminibacterium sp.]